MFQQLGEPFKVGAVLLVIAGGLACSSSSPRSDSGSTTGPGAGGVGGGGGGSTGGDGGSAGEGGTTAPCTPPSIGCSDGEKCSIAKESLGIPDGLECVKAGSREAFQPCDADSVCAAGLWCDHTTAVCKPLCNVGGLACPGPTDCIVGRDSAGLPIVGLGVCLSRCNPIAALDNPCGGSQVTTCFYRADEDGFDCGQSGDKAWPNACTSHQDCAYGLGCVGNTCRDWCPTIGVECVGTKGDGSWYCENFSPCGTCTDAGLTSNDAPLGACL